MIQTGSDSLYGDPGRGPWPLSFVECGFFWGGRLCHPGMGDYELVILLPHAT